MDAMKGTISRVFLNRGFAFARGEDGLAYFSHANDFEPRISFDTLREGQTVEFNPTRDPGPNARGNGMRARNIRVCA